jgi:hypothetical protein
MRVSQDITFGVTGQLVYFDAPEGRPSSVTSCEVFNWASADDYAALTGSGSVETNPNTTVDAVSGAGQTNPNILNVTATTGFAVDRQYLVTGADGYREWIEVAEIDSGNTVTAKHPLHNAYASADTVQSTRLVATIDSTWVADETNLDDTAGPNPTYRVRWVYVVAGVTYVADSYFSLVRYAGVHGVKPQDIESMHPGWLDRLPTDHRRDQGRALINRAHSDVKLDLHGVWTDDAMVANAELIDQLVIRKTIELGEEAKVMTGNSDGRAYELAQKRYMMRFDALVRITNKAPIRDVDGSATHRSSFGLTRR